MSPYRVLIFDFDGTLCATEEAIQYTFRQTFEQKGEQVPTPDEIRRGIGTGGNLSTILPLLRPSLAQNSAELENWITAYRHIYDTEGGHKTTLFAGAEEVLQRLAVQGIRCVLLSNKGQQAIEDALRRFNLASSFDLVLGDNPALPLAKKPDPMAFHQVIQPKYPTVKPTEFLMVGDTLPDIEFARHAGISSCWAAFGYGDPALCRQAGPTHTLQALNQLLALPLLSAS